jgi:essential nuclear protein 1
VYSSLFIVLFFFQAGDCTLKEAVILSSVLSKTSIPVLHSSAALIKIAEMKYSGWCSSVLSDYFILSKKMLDGLTDI